MATTKKVTKKNSPTPKSGDPGPKALQEMFVLGKGSKAPVTKSGKKKDVAPPPAKPAGTITLVFSDGQLDFPNSKTARKFLRDEGLSVKLATEKSPDGMTWTFDQAAPEKPALLEAEE